MDSTTNYDRNSFYGNSDWTVYLSDERTKLRQYFHKTGYVIYRNDNLKKGKYYVGGQDEYFDNLKDAKRYVYSSYLAKNNIEKNQKETKEPTEQYRSAAKLTEKAKVLIEMKQRIENSAVIADSITFDMSPANKISKAKKNAHMVASGHKDFKQVGKDKDGNILIFEKGNTWVIRGEIRGYGLDKIVAKHILHQKDLTYEDIVNSPEIKKHSEEYIAKNGNTVFDFPSKANPIFKIVFGTATDNKRNKRLLKNGSEFKTLKSMYQMSANGRLSPIIPNPEFDSVSVSLSSEFSELNTHDTIIPKNTNQVNMDGAETMNTQELPHETVQMDMAFISTMLTNKELKEKYEKANSMIAKSKIIKELSDLATIEEGAFSDVATKTAMKEIDDSEISFSLVPRNAKNITLGDIMEAPLLFSKYPQLRNIKIKHLGARSIYNGQYRPSENAIYLSPPDADEKGVKKINLTMEEADTIEVNRLFGDRKKLLHVLTSPKSTLSESNIAKGKEYIAFSAESDKQKEKEINRLPKTYETQKSIILHELQHAIQEIENWGKDGVLTDTRYINDTSVMMLDKITIYNKSYKNSLPYNLWRIEAKISIPNIRMLALPLHEFKEIINIGVFPQCKI